MADSEKKRVRRSVDERAAEFDKKIQKANAQITDLETKKKDAVAEFDGKIAASKAKVEKLEAAKAELLKPKAPRKPRKTKKQKMDELVKKMEKSGMKPEEIAKKLGLELDN